MSAFAVPDGTSPDDLWRIPDDDEPAFLPHRVKAGVRPEDVPRYGDPSWALELLYGGTKPLTVWFEPYDQAVGLGRKTGIPEAYRKPVRQVIYLLANFDTPDELMDEGRRRRREDPGVGSKYSVFTALRLFAWWLVERPTPVLRLCDVTPEDLAAFVAEQAVADQTLKVRTAAITRLWFHGRHLPPQDRLCAPPWVAEQWTWNRTSPSENLTPWIDPDVMAALLTWSLRAVDDMAPQIMQAWADKERLQANIRSANGCRVSRSDVAYHQGVEAARDYLRERVDGGGGLPPATVLAGTFGLVLSKARSLIKPFRDELTYEDTFTFFGMSPARGTHVGGWPRPVPGEPIRWFTVEHMCRKADWLAFLKGACLVVVAYLSGMRPGEVLRLQRGCHQVQTLPDGRLRHVIHGHIYKTATDERGNYKPDGEPHEWVVIEPVARAVRLLETLTDAQDLFAEELSAAPEAASATSAGADDETDRDESDQTTLAAVESCSRRVRQFAHWCNVLAEHHGLQHEMIPDDPYGPIAMSRFRRTIAWFIINRPGGRVALALQYGHIGDLFQAEGYGSRASSGMAEMVNNERLRAQAERLVRLDESVRAGDGVSGPAAPRLIKTATELGPRFPGRIVGTKAELKLILKHPDHSYHDNPSRYMGCLDNPATRACVPRNPAGGADALPDLQGGDCSACANMVMTDEQARQAEAHARDLSQQACMPEVPEPYAKWLLQHANEIKEQADRHWRGRITVEPLANHEPSLEGQVADR